MLNPNGQTTLTKQTNKQANKQTKQKKDEAGEIGGELEDNLYSISRGFQRYGKIFEEDFWKEIGEGLSVCQKDLQVKETKDGRTRFLKQELFEDGYINVEPLQRNPNLEKLVKIVRKLKKMGWPPVFIYVFDEAWEILQDLDSDGEFVGRRVCFRAFHVLLFPRISTKASQKGHIRWRKFWIASQRS